MLKFNKIKFTKHLNIINFILWLSILVKVINENGVNLKVPCIIIIFYILFDITKNIWKTKGDK